MRLWLVFYLRMCVLRLANTELNIPVDELTDKENL